MPESISKKAYNMLIDALSNSMDYCSEDEFAEWAGRETQLSESLLRLVHKEYWLLDPIAREHFYNAEWTSWIDDMARKQAQDAM